MDEAAPEQPGRLDQEWSPTGIADVDNAVAAVRASVGRPLAERVAALEAAHERLRTALTTEPAG